MPRQVAFNKTLSLKSSLKGNWFFTSAVWYLKLNIVMLLPVQPTFVSINFYECFRFICLPKFPDYNKSKPLLYLLKLISRWADMYHSDIILCHALVALIFNTETFPVSYSKHCVPVYIVVCLKIKSFPRN